ncbi:hypothetical protein CHS0354_041805 [Potamilus streckersoni]|uniref:Uncharacterized protein n=1 Tax=Potamilus streckersoni TaxID=2493646 RepID=A0AAE0T139_9BIVA|nr:hypothetical protein CHS0354_041805 [Potamilus streckersoni]
MNQVQSIGISFRKFRKPGPAKQTDRMQSFLEAGSDATFSQIRKRLQKLTLNVDYSKGLANLQGIPVHDKKPRFKHQTPHPQIGHRDTDQMTTGKYHYALRSNGQNDGERVRINSYSSRYSDTSSSSTSSTPGTETIGSYRSSYTNTSSPLFDMKGQKIRLRDRLNVSQQGTPRSEKQFEGRAHFGLIDSLDLREKLKDVNKIKERYSKEEFLHSLSHYKLRGHDRCFDLESKQLEYIQKRTKFLAPITPNTMLSEENLALLERKNSSVRLEGAYEMENVPEEPGYGKRTKSPRTIKSNIEIKFTEPLAPSRVSMHTVPKRRKVEFDLTPRRLEAIDSVTQKELKPILKRKEKESLEEEGLLFSGQKNAFSPTKIDVLHLPRISDSMIHSPGVRKEPPSVMFRKKIYPLGFPGSDEFESVIDRYGNCRQNSMVQDTNIVRDTSMARESSTLRDSNIRRNSLPKI